MRITSLSLRNWRTFTRLDVELGERLFVIGPNASGKSHLLDSVRFLSDLARPGGGVRYAVDARGGLSHIRSGFAKGTGGARVRVRATLGDDDEPDTWTYSLAMRGAASGRIVAEEVVEHRGKVVAARPDAADRDDPERLSQTAVEQVFENKAFRPLAEYLARVRYLHLVPQIVRDPARGGEQEDDPFGGDFVNRIAQLPGPTRTARLNRVTEALRLAVPEFGTLSVTTDDLGRPHLATRYVNQRRRDSTQDERDLSDGTLRLIGLLWSLVGSGRDATILLEEPELNLHPSVVRLLARVLARAQRSSSGQVLMTTHSPELLSDEGIRPDEVLVLDRQANGSTATLLAADDAALRQFDSGLNVAEIGLPRSEPPDVEGLARINVGGR